MESAGTILENFLQKTQLLLPSSDLSDEMRNSFLIERERILSKLKEYIDKILEPKKQNILNPTKDNFEKVPEISEILAELNVTDREYDSARSIHVKWFIFSDIPQKTTNACFIGNFFSEGYKHGKQILILNLYSIIIKQ